MDTDQRPNQRRKRQPKPLNKVRMEEIALAYVARFATSAAKLEAYLARKLRERGWEDEDENAPDIPALTHRYVELGFVDDEAFARAKSGSLLRRGYGQRRVNQALGAAGIAPEVRETVHASAAAQRAAALAMASKRGFGPYATLRGKDRGDRAMREKHVAAMLRAGHNFDHVRRVIDAGSVDDLEQWLAEAKMEEE